MAFDSGKKCAVVGAGINGLCSAISLAQKGFDVSVFSAQDPMTTTSAVAGAIWMPYKCKPEDKVLEWAAKSLVQYSAFAKIKGSGVTWRNHTEFFNHDVPKPAWMSLLSEGHAPSCVLPADAHCHYSVRLPVINTPQFIAYQCAKLTALSVKIEVRLISDFSELSDYDVIVNTSGVGARTLAHDDSIYPVKGQTFELLHPVSPITESIFYDRGDEGLATLVVPHEDHVTIGVTYKEHDASCDYDEAAEARLFESACAFYPQLVGSKPSNRRVGHRPVREAGVVLQKRVVGGQTIVDNYGHAGGGITLAPGCAEEVAEWVRAL